MLKDLQSLIKSVDNRYKVAIDDFKQSITDNSITDTIKVSQAIIKSEYQQLLISPIKRAIEKEEWNLAFNHTINLTSKLEQQLTENYFNSNSTSPLHNAVTEIKREAVSDLYLRLSALEAN
jgi:hypothetical protein